MVSLTFVFVLLYGAALVGWLRPLADEKMVVRLEPIIFVVIGYYFGRLPSQQNERMLREEIVRQTQKADAAQHAKEQALQTREALEEKMKAAAAALDSKFLIGETVDESSSIGKAVVKGWPQAVKTAINILKS